MNGKLVSRPSKLVSHPWKLVWEAWKLVSHVSKRVSDASKRGSGGGTPPLSPLQLLQRPPLLLPAGAGEPPLVQPAQELRHRPAGELPDAGDVVAEDLGALGGAVAVEIAQGEEGLVALLQAVEEAVQVPEHLLALLLGGHGLGEHLQEGRIDRLEAVDPLLPPVDGALVAEGDEEPALLVADLGPAAEGDDQGLLEEVVGVLVRDPVLGEDPPHLRTRGGDQLFELRP